MTDNIKALANQTGLTRAAIRGMAADLGLQVTYSAPRRTWIIDEAAATVRAFNVHLVEVAA